MPGMPRNFLLTGDPFYPLPLRHLQRLFLHVPNSLRLSLPAVFCPADDTAPDCPWPELLCSSGKTPAAFRDPCLSGIRRSPQAVPYRTPRNGVPTCSIYCSDGHCHRSPVSVFRLTASPAGTAVPASYDPQTVRNISQHTGWSSSTWSVWRYLHHCVETPARLCAVQRSSHILHSEWMQAGRE